VSLYVDPPFNPGVLAVRLPFSRTARVAHLSADTVEELCLYLVAGQFPVSYLHRPRSYHFHYDLYGPYLKFVLADPEVQKLTRRGYVRKLQAKRRNR
jgi:hypothetical protein